MAERRELSLKLYVLNDGSLYQEQLDRISAAVMREKGVGCEIDIVDLSEWPEQAEEKQILAIPTLIKEFPTPALRMIGSLDDVDQIIKLLVSA